MEGSAATKEKMKPSASDESGNGSSQPSGTDEPQTTEGQSQTTDLTSEGAPSADSSEGTQSPFTHPRLRGRSPEEVERLFSTMEATVFEQKRNLDEMYSQTRPAPAAEGPTPTASNPTDKDFWNDPVSTMDQLIERRLKDIVKPFEENLREGRASEAERRMREMYSDFDDYKDFIDELARRANNPAPNFDELQSYYLYAVGVASRRPDAFQPGGGSARPSPTPTNEARPVTQQPTAPPQHRASSQPLPDNRPREQKRPLTENEKRLAREFGLTEDEFRDEQLSSEGPMEL